MSEKVVNIVNFIRGIEPRLPMDLHRPVVEQMRLAKQHRLPTTWLLQYDALLDPFYVDLLKKEMPPDHEIGIWFEVVQPMVERCGLPWRGRYPWDWHADVGFPMGYTPHERELLADEFIRLFRETFGFAPKSMGSWVFDAHLLTWLHERHGIESACNCKDQWGTDGYTLWGGYWANAYYPSRRNAYLPAIDPANQIPVPVFRMLGSDPIYQYDADPGVENGQPVITLEPVYTGFGRRPAGGGIPSWIDWFFRNNFADPVMALGYAQVGQENSFGWDKMGQGLCYQYAKLAELRAQGALRVETLGETGRRFRANHPVTPVSSVCALEDWQESGRASVWYLSRFGRINLVRNAEGRLAIRDWQLNSDDYAERYLTDICRSNACIYDALPVCDGMRWHASMVFELDGQPATGAITGVVADDAETLRLSWNDGEIELTARETKLAIRHTGRVLRLIFGRENRDLCRIEAVDGQTLRYEYNGQRYELLATGAALSAEAGSWVWEARGAECVLETRLIQD